MGRRLIDISGHRFGRWTVLKFSGSKLWECLCDCGRKSEIRGTDLRRGRSTQCKSCSNGENTRVHGQSVGNKTKAYKAWKGMIFRCTNPTAASYPRYGGRGIQVCTRWRSSFVDFLSDVGAPPGPDYSLDRIDNDGNYEPGNVRWATLVQQRRNNSYVRPLTLNGETMLLIDWAKRIGISEHALSRRLRFGWSVEKALTTGRMR
jgi:hypothetical protein